LLKPQQVSVIIPVYNGDRFIVEAVESVLQQTYPNVEIIVVDDGSVDRSGAVLQLYGDRIRYVYQMNQGVAAARNAGITIAQGELIAFLDQDDFFLPDKLTVQVDRLTADPALAMVSSGWRIVDAQGKTMADIQPWHGIPELTSANWVIWKPVFLGAMLFRQSVLGRSTGFNSQLQQTSDVELILRLIQAGCQTAWVPQTTVCYRQHPDNASRNALQQAQEMEVVLEQFFNQPDLSPSLRQFASRSRYQSLVWSAWRLYHLGERVAMVDYLKKSLSYASGTPSETILDWINSFQQYASESGCHLDIHALTQFQEWRALVQNCLLYPVFLDRAGDYPQ